MRAFLCDIGNHKKKRQILMNWLKRIREAFHLPTQHEISMTNLKNYRGHYPEKVEKVVSTQ